MKRIFVFLFLLSALSSQLSAQDSIPENRTYFGIGYSSLYDSYLSPLHYRGVEFRIVHEKEHWGMDGYFSYTANPAKNAHEYTANFNVNYSYLKHWQFAQHLDFAAGGKAEAFVGGTLSSRNGNNPGQLRTGLDIAPTIRAKYDFQLWKKKWLVSYRGSMPLVGLQFSPQYGQSYYEIFCRKNYDHNICLFGPWTGLTYTHRIILDIPLGKHHLSVGYMGDYEQHKLNNIRYHNFSHLGVIGWSF